MKSHITAIAVLFLGAFLIQTAWGCSLNWSEPRSRIEGCNENGHVLVAERLAEVTIPDEERSVPIWATFDSSRTAASPFAGMSWRIAFLEPSLIQLGENDFLLYEPGGWRRFFWRDAKDRNVLNGAGDWKGQISKDNKDKITVWATCGWRLDFVQGKITQIKTAKDKTVVYNYANGRLASITCDEKTLVSIDPVEKEGKLTIMIEDKKYTLEKSDRPNVQRNKNTFSVAGNTPCLHRWSGEGMSSRTFNYSMDAKTNPVMTIVEDGKPDTVIGWHPETRTIMRYGKWMYDIKPSKALWENAAIGRTNVLGQREFWFYDVVKGRNTVRRSNGVTETKIWFTSGILDGKIRNETIESPDGSKEETQYSYDERARLVRKIVHKTKTGGAKEILSSTMISYSNFDSSLPPSLIKMIARAEKTTSASNGDLVEWKYYDKNERLIGQADFASNLTEFIRDSKGRTTTWLVNGIQRMAFSFDADSVKPSKRIEYVDDGQTILKEKEYAYDAQGKKILERTTCGYFGTREVTYTYDLFGALVKVNSSLTGEYVINK